MKEISKKDIFIEEKWKGKKPEKETIHEEEIKISFDSEIYFDETIEEEEIFFPEEKTNTDKIENTLLYPYICIGVISGKVSGRKCYGTGSLIAPNIVLTCAHNCFYKEEKSEMENLEFWPAVNGKIGKNYKVKKCHYPVEYQEKIKPEEYNLFDFAVLELEKSLEENYGYLGIDSSLQNMNGADFIEVCGYP